MKNLFSPLLLFCLALVARPAMAEEGGYPAVWTEAEAPFSVFRNVHYVGTKGISAFLITGPKGHILLDGGMAESAPLVIANIKALGFDPADVRYLLINHAHYDHCGALAELKKATGALLLAGEGDIPVLEAGRDASRPELGAFAPVKVDHAVKNGEVLKLGETVMKAILTSGHTAGSVSWETRIGGKRILFASSLTVAGLNLIGNPGYPEAVKDFRATFVRLKKRKADIFLTFHPEFFNMAEKRIRQEAGDDAAFIDSGEMQKRVAAAESAFVSEWERQKNER